MTNLTRIKAPIFYKWVYPLLAREFLLGSDYEAFTDLVKRFFTLSKEQWEEVLEEWEYKEYNLKD